jgi:hypothetical protein
MSRFDRALSRIGALSQDLGLYPDTLSRSGGGTVRMRIAGNTRLKNLVETEDLVGPRPEYTGYALPGLTFTEGEVLEHSDGRLFQVSHPIEPDATRGWNVGLAQIKAELYATTLHPLVETPGTSNASGYKVTSTWTEGTPVQGHLVPIGGEKAAEMNSLRGVKLRWTFYTTEDVSGFRVNGRARLDGQDYGIEELEATREHKRMVLTRESGMP